MKKLWMVIPALLLMAGMVLTGCGNGTTTPETPAAIDWSVTADGDGASGTGTVTTTKITITFNANVATLRGQDVILEGPVSSTHGTPSKGAGNAWDVPVTPTGSGSVSVRISASGIAAGPKPVQVWLAGAEQTIGFTAEAADGASGTATTTKITLTFDEDVDDLDVDDIEIITLQQTGSATKGTLTPTSDAKVWELGITVATQGNIQVKITKSGIDDTPRTVPVYQDLTQGIVIPPDGDDGSYSWTKLTIDHTDDEGDPEKTAENEELGKGLITGADFDAIVDATQYKDTFLRLYVDFPASGYPGGALGYRKDAQGVLEGSLNLTFSKPTTGYVVNIPLKSLKNYYEVSDGKIFVNVWSGAKMVGIQLWVPMDPEDEEVLPDGYWEITLPNDDSVLGKGFLGSADMAAINAAGPDAYLEIHGVQGNGGWGALIYNNSWTGINGLSFLSGGSSGTTFVEEVTIAEIRTLVSAPVGTALQVIGFNLYQGGYFTEMYLVDPDAMDPNAPIPYTALADGGAHNTSTKITFNFVRELTSALEATDIVITDGTGSVTKGAVTGSAKVWELEITVVTAGNITVAIPNRPDINDGDRPVVVYFVAPIVVPGDGDDATYTWTNLTIVDTVDPTKSDLDIGKGFIAGADFDLIVDAKGWKDTFLRIYVDQSEVGQWPGGALGNLDNFEGGSNLGFSAPASGDYVDRTIKDLKKYFDDTDGSIYVNPWNGLKVVGILLFVPKDKEAESQLPDGVTEITLGAADGVPGKGSLGSLDVAAINAAAPGSFLELYVVGCTQTNAGWGIGTIGPTYTAGDCLTIPSQGTGDFTVIIQIDDLRAKYTGDDINTIIINLYDCDGLSKIWLRQPVVTELTLPTGEDIPGKGNLDNADLAKIKTAKDGAFIKVYISGAQHSGGIGTFIQHNEQTATTPVSINISGSGDQIATVMVADILAYFVATGNDGWLAVNVWNCDAVTKIELVEP